MKKTQSCLECGKTLTPGVQLFSLEIYGFPLCLKHQIYIEETGAPAYAVALYYALKSKDIPVVLEYHQGYKHIDIALPGKLHIEVNVSNHVNRLQALTDLNRTRHLLEAHIPTIPIAKILLKKEDTFRQTVEELAQVCKPLLK